MKRDIPVRRCSEMGWLNWTQGWEGGEEMPTHRGSWPFRNKVPEKDQYH